MRFSEALEELKEKSKPRAFEQTIELIVNLKNFDLKREHFSITVSLPFPYKKKKIAAFLEKEFPGVEVDYIITKENIDKITKSEARKLVKNYDCFIANAKLMPFIAKNLGKVLSSAGKMPDPSLGAVLTHENKEAIIETVRKLEKTIKIKVKEASIKVPIGKETTPVEQIESNASAILNALIASLPKGKQNIRSVLLKFTMSPPIKVKE